jgi:putative transposase
MTSDTAAAATERMTRQRNLGAADGVKQVSDRIWLVSFMDYDSGFFDDETCRLESAINPFEAKVLPMSPV